MVGILYTMAVKTKPKLLLVEDDNSLASLLKKTLSQKYTIDTTKYATKAKELIRATNYDLLVLDVVLEDKDGTTGLDVCKYVREKNKEVPILFVTGKTAINYKLGAFKFGADDYLCKPFNTLELKARIEALLKRTKTPKKQILTVGELLLDQLEKSIKRNGKKIHLRKKEFELLEYLMLNKNKVLTRDMILDALWTSEEICSNSVDVHIRNLRKKLNTNGKQDLIKTVYGFGYKLEQTT